MSWGKIAARDRLLGGIASGGAGGTCPRLREAVGLSRGVARRREESGGEEIRGVCGLGKGVDGLRRGLFVWGGEKWGAYGFEHEVQQGRQG